MTPLTPAGQALLDELAESPLSGARYARQAVGLRLPLAERQAEARGADRALADLRREVEGLRRLYMRLPEDGGDSEDAAIGSLLNEVLALIDKASREEGA